MSTSSLKYSEQDSTDLEDVATSTNQVSSNGGVFASGGDVKLYEPIPEYEGKHRYDPAAQWTEKEEKAVLRKVFSFCSLFILYHLLKFCLDGLENMHVGVPHVLCPSTRSW